ncbi:MAG TPA: CZB domain-containing protein, partial [Leptospiraceae bacterium]|nr:CZB domain-containing protein [Leptospiraceae bacterium]
MDFDKAIATHVEWKAKLRSYLKNLDSNVDPKIVEKDTECSLGKWIYGEGAKYKDNEYYLQLVSEHARFHICAAAVIREIIAGNISKAESMIGLTSEYTEVSASIVTKIRKMRD